jgi:hypothetical protein
MMNDYPEKQGCKVKKIFNKSINFNDSFLRPPSWGRGLGSGVFKVMGYGSGGEGLSASYKFLRIYSVILEYK